MMKSDTDDFRQSLQPMLVNRDREKELLSVCPHRDITDEISCIAVSSETYAPVNYHKAIQNQSEHTYRLSTIEDVLGNASGEITPPTSLLVLTNSQSFWGSSEILNETAMEDAATRLRSVVKISIRM